MNRKPHLIISLSIAVLMLNYSWPKKSRHKEKVIKRSSSAKLKSFDPIYSDNQKVNYELALVYDSLFEYHYLLSPITLRPRLLAKMPEISKDKKSLIFELKQGVLFHDDPCYDNMKDRILTSDDVIYSLKRAADINLNGLTYYAISDKIVGLDEWRNEEKDNVNRYDLEIEGLRKIDKYKFEIRLNKPVYNLLYILAQPPFAIVSKRACKYYKEKIGIHPIGTGPFRIVREFNRLESKVEYIKYKDYREEYFPAQYDKKHQQIAEEYKGRKLPMIDRIITKIIPGSSPNWSKEKYDKLDIIEIPTENNLNSTIDSNGNLSEELQKNNLRLIRGLEGSTDMFLFNNSRPLFRNPKVRKAITIVIDRNILNRLFYQNTSVIAQSIMPPGVHGYEPNFINPLYISIQKTQKEKELLIQKARQLLKEAGYPNPRDLPQITIDTRAERHDRQMGEYIRDQLKEIGFNAKVITNTSSDLLHKLKSKSYDLMKKKCVIDSPDGADLLSQFYGPRVATESNLCYFENDKFDKIFDSIQDEFDIKKRTLLIKKCNRVLTQMAPVIFLIHPQKHIIINKKIKNYIMGPLKHGLEKYLDIQE